MFLWLELTGLAILWKDRDLSLHGLVVSMTWLNTTPDPMWNKHRFRENFSTFSTISLYNATLHKLMSHDWTLMLPWIVNNLKKNWSWSNISIVWGLRLWRAEHNWFWHSIWSDSGYTFGKYLLILEEVCYSAIWLNLVTHLL